MDRKLVLFFLALCLSVIPSIVLAQDFADLPEAPRISTDDKAGVDLRSGEYKAGLSGRTIGPQNNPALQITTSPLTRSSYLGTPRHSKIERGCELRYTQQGGFYQCRNTVSIYTLGNETFTYQHIPGAIELPHYLNDGTYVIEDDLNIDIYRPDGSLWRFLKAANLSADWQYEPREIATLKIIEQPDGAALEYDSRGVTSTYGYRWEDVPSNGQPLLNLSANFCATGSTPCEGLDVRGRGNNHSETNTASNGSFPVARNVNITNGDGLQIDLTQGLVGALSG